MLTFSTVPFKLNDSTCIYNLSSYLPDFTRINILPMIVDENYYESVDIDISYTNKIFSDYQYFMEFMGKLIMPLYYNQDVVLLINNNPIFLLITEMIQKLISERYGYISNIVLSTDDIETLVDGDFSVRGVMNLDVDKTAYNDIMVKRGVL